MGGRVRGWCIPACNGCEGVGWCVSQHAMGGWGLCLSQHAMGERGGVGVYPSMQWVGGGRVVCIPACNGWVGVMFIPACNGQEGVGWCIPACNGWEGRGGVYPGMQWVGGVVFIPACNGRGPPGKHPLPSPPDGHWSGRYAAYWNAFLFKFCNFVRRRKDE